MIVSCRVINQNRKFKPIQKVPKVMEKDLSAGVMTFTYSADNSGQSLFGSSASNVQMGIVVDAVRFTSCRQTLLIGNI